MGTRRQSRELTLQFLYQYDVLMETGEGEGGCKDLVDAFWDNLEVTVDESAEEFARVLMLGTCENIDSIDRIIECYSEHWKVPRMPKIDRNILRMAVFELVYLGGIPPAVTINEAIELAKKYGTEESGAFVNGILDKVRIAMSRGEIGYDKRVDI